MYKYKTASTKPNSGTCQEKGLMKVKKKKQNPCAIMLYYTLETCLKNKRFRCETLREGKHSFLLTH